MAALQPKLEPTGLLSDDPQARPADTLLVVPLGVQQNSWRKFPRIAIDVAVTSPYQQASMADSTQAEVSSATRYAERKWQNQLLASRCNAANLGYEPLVFESTGGLEKGGYALLSSIYSLVDQCHKRRGGDSLRECLGRLSFDLQRGLQAAIQAHRTLQCGHMCGLDGVETFLYMGTL